MHLMLLVYLLACHRRDSEQEQVESEGGSEEKDTGEAPVEDSEAPEETGGETGGETGAVQETAEPDSGKPVHWPDAVLADLAELSDGACPNLDESGTSSFLSSGTERTVTVLLPERRSEAASVVFFFHGLTTPDYGESPGAYMAEAMYLQDVADELGAVIVLPDAPLRDLLVYEFFLWDVENVTGDDLVLYDDLRTCLATELDVNLSKFYAMGFSGGALFATEVLAHRADTLAAAIEISGGANITIPFYDYTVAPYSSAAWTVPTLVISGGESDVWPDESLVLIDFESASDTLTEALVADSHLVARCTHDDGHTITWDGYNFAIDWVAAHAFGAASPFSEEGIPDDHADWCTLFGP